MVSSETDGFFYNSIAQTVSIFIALASVFAVYRLELQDQNIKDCEKNLLESKKRVNLRKNLKKEAWCHIKTLSFYLMGVVFVGSTAQIRGISKIKVLIGVLGIMLLFSLLDFIKKCLQIHPDVPGYEGTYRTPSERDTLGLLL